jgi:hypothetical protein
MDHAAEDRENVLALATAAYTLQLSGYIRSANYNDMQQNIVARRSPV